MSPNPLTNTYILDSVLQEGRKKLHVQHRKSLHGETADEKHIHFLCHKALATNRNILSYFVKFRQTDLQPVKYRGVLLL